MNAEEFIYAWKNEQQSGKKPGKAHYSAKKPGKEPGEAPSNPVGGQELSDDELQLIEGGEGSSLQCTIGHCQVTQ